jgi:hypothetical protein
MLSSLASVAAPRPEGKTGRRDDAGAKNSLRVLLER